ncbi:MAG: group III truncated hemoglobin [Raineya sp.]|jgi:hemoglobin|nr:group III truncated hemoglobin [Raineya sp.]
MKTDILNIEDIKHLIDTFYEKVRKDTVISHFFTEVVTVDWEKHLPIMYKFWSNILFNIGEYTGNPMQKHLNLHKKSPMRMQDFQHWLQLFTETTDELFEGINAEIIKQRATSIATVMQAKIYA